MIEVMVEEGLYNWTVMDLWNRFKALKKVNPEYSRQSNKEREIIFKYNIYVWNLLFTS